MTKTFQRLLHHEAFPGLLLVAATLLALLMANSPLRSFYEDFLATPVVVQLGDFEIAKPLLLWINDGLMAVFFFLIGLEIKREVLQGQLSSFDKVLLPGIAAIGGIAAPALIYAWINQGQPVSLQGWAIPSATDIAFALGIFMLFGSLLPASLKIFLLSVAIFDDIGAILIIALFYSTDLTVTSLVIALAGLGVLMAFNRMGVRKPAPYILVGLVVWAAVLKSGVHATLAGFAVAWFIPIAVKNEYGKPMLEHLEHGIHPWVAFLILPLFAFANAGVSLGGLGMEELINPVTAGIVLGLFIGKQIGVFGLSWLAIKAGVAKLPAGASWMQLYGVCLLCGVGFTMSLFIGTLAFEHSGTEYIGSVKLGVLMGSLLSALVGALILFCSGRRSHANQPAQESPAYRSENPNYT